MPGQYGLRTRLKSSAPRIRCEGISLLDRRRFADELVKLSSDLSRPSPGENELFTKLRALRDGLSKIPELSKEPFHLAFIKIHDEDFRGLALNKVTPSIKFEDTPDFEGVQQPKVGVYDGIPISLGATMRGAVFFNFGQYEMELMYTAAENTGNGEYKLYNPRLSFWKPICGKWKRQLI